MSERRRRRELHLPVLTALRGAGKVRPTVEAAAAITLLVIAVPEQLATSRLAGMPPVTGLYAFVAGTVAFAVIGSNPQMSVGADSTIAPLFAAALVRLAPTGSPHYQALAGILAVCVGILVAAVGLLRLGWIAEFFSAPIVTGFLAGVAVIIVVHQLPDVLGLAAPTGTTLERLVRLGAHIGSANAATVAISIFVLAVVVLAERVDRRLPGALFGLVIVTVAVAAGNLEEHGVAVLGAVAHGAPRLGLRDLSWSTLGTVLPLAAVVALVVVSQSAVTTRAFAEEGGFDIDVDRDFAGVGAGSILAGLTGSFPVNASPARTAAVATAGGRSQLSGLGAAGAVVLLVPAAGVLRDVPVAALGAILVFVAGRLFHVGDLRTILRFDRVEFALAVVTLLTVALVGVEQGVGLAVALAILDRARRSAQPNLHLMGRIPGTTSWEPVDRSGAQQEVPGVLVALFAAPLYYANAEHFSGQLQALLHRGAPPLVLVLDVIGMHDIDYTGTRVLARLLDQLEHDHVALALARCGETLQANLERSGLLGRIGAQRLFPSADAAVTASMPGGAQP